MRSIAEAAGHFTPASFNDELKKLFLLKTVDIYLYHLKPQYRALIEDQISSISRDNVKILKEGEIIEI